MQYLASLNGNIVHISHAQMHKSGYTCLCCGKDMIVYKNLKRGKDHFQHRAGTCAETSDDVLINYAIQYLLQHKDKMFNIGKDNNGKSIYVNLEQFKAFKCDKLGKKKAASNGWTTTVYPDLYFENRDKEIYVYITNKKRVGDAELQKYSALTSDGKYPWDVYVVNIQMNNLIKFFNDPDIVDMYVSYDHYIERALYEDIDTNVRRNVYWFGNSDYLRRQSQKPLKKLGTTNYKSNVDGVKQRKMPKNMYGTCGVCDESLELVINTYNDVSKPIADISTEHIRDDKNEDKDLQARFDLGALLLRCPKCHRVMTVKCPRCLQVGKINDMKLLINYKRQHIYACCEDYHSITDIVTGSCKMKKEDVCNTSLILYSDVDAQTVSEEQKRVGGFFNWLTHFNEVNYKKEED